MHIRKDDTVEVISGSDRGVRGAVMSIDREANRLMVEGVNRVWRHVPKSKRNPQGGRLHKEAAIAASNVLLVCSACNAATRTGARYLDDGSKVRYCKKCDANIGEIAPPKKSS